MQFVKFELLLVALTKYIEQDQHHTFPLSGRVPDMTSTTTYYTQLQTIYQSKAEQDMKKFKLILSETMSSLASSTSISPTEEYIELFCKNAIYLHSITTRTLAQEYSTPDQDAIDEVSLVFNCGVFADSLQEPLWWYFALRAAGKFYSNTGRMPGSNDSSYDSDCEEIYSYIVQYCKQYQLEEEFLKLLQVDEEELHQDIYSPLKNYAIEICRYADCELHTIDTIIGGAASQEAIKIITKQYVPISGTYVYNGIACSSATYKL